MARPPTRTLRAISFNLEPWHAWHCSASPSSSHSLCRSRSSSCSMAESSRGSTEARHTSPNPLHSVHHPWGELYENNRGSSSSNDCPHSGQLISVLTTVE